MNLSNNKFAEHTINEGFRLSPVSSIAKSISALFMKNTFNGSPLLFIGTLAIIILFCTLLIIRIQKKKELLT